MMEILNDCKAAWIFNNSFDLPSRSGHEQLIYTTACKTPPSIRISNGSGDNFRQMSYKLGQFSLIGLTLLLSLVQLGEARWTNVKTRGYVKTTFQREVRITDEDKNRLVNETINIIIEMDEGWFMFDRAMKINRFNNSFAILKYGLIGPTS